MWITCHWHIWHFSTSLYSLQYATIKLFKIIVILICSLPKRTALATFLGSSLGQNVLYWSRGPQLLGHRFRHPLANLNVMYTWCTFINSWINYPHSFSQVREYCQTRLRRSFPNTWRPKWLLHKRKRTWRYFGPESLTRLPGRTCWGSPSWDRTMNTAALVKRWSIDIPYWRDKDSTMSG